MLFALGSLFLCAIFRIANCQEGYNLMVTNVVFFDVSYDGDVSKTHRVTFGLFGDVTPKTVANFVQLADHTPGFGYRGATFHRVIKDFMIQGGDFLNHDGTGSKSIYGQYFDDEDFSVRHYGAGWLAMANAGANTNGMQFYVTLKRTSWLDGSHVVFGKVLEGMEHIYAIGNVATDDKDKPKKDVVIVNSGSIKVDKPYPVTQDDVVA